MYIFYVHAKVAQGKKSVLFGRFIRANSVHEALTAAFQELALQTKKSTRLCAIAAYPFN